MRDKKNQGESQTCEKKESAIGVSVRSDSSGGEDV